MSSSVVVSSSVSLSLDKVMTSIGAVLVGSSSVSLSLDKVMISIGAVIRVTVGVMCCIRKLNSSSSLSSIVMTSIVSDLPLSPWRVAISSTTRTVGWMMAIGLFFKSTGPSGRSSSRRPFVCSFSFSLGFTGVCSLDVEGSGSSALSVVSSSAVATVKSTGSKFSTVSLDKSKGNSVWLFVFSILQASLRVCFFFEIVELVNLLLVCSLYIFCF